MQLNSKMQMLDGTLCAYISSKDPLRKSSMDTVFMQKKQLFTFYGKMLYKTKQEIKLQQGGNLNLYKDHKKLLKRQEQRIRQKIYSRTFHMKNEMNRFKLNEKENIKINQSPIISNNPLKLKPIKGKTDSKFLNNANRELLLTEFIKQNQNQNQKSRKNKSLSHSRSVYNNENIFSNNNFWVSNQESNFLPSQSNKQWNEEQPQRKMELIQLYQKLYQQFNKQNLKNHSTSKAQGKFSKAKLNLNPHLSKPNTVNQAYTKHKNQLNSEY